MLLPASVLVALAVVAAWMAWVVREYRRDQRAARGSGWTPVDD